MKETDIDEREEQATGSSHEGDGHSATPQVQTPDKPSQAEGDRETIDVSIKEKEAANNS